VSTTPRKTAHDRDRVNRSHLWSKREHYLETLKQLVENRDANCFSEKATILLTHHWTKTPWRGRAALLLAADWLIRIGADFHQ
jgi:hypothetical protein